MKTDASLAAMPIELQAVHTIRTLAMDAVQKANSGHPGTAMALAPLAYVLWRRHLRFNPVNPQWPDRDRFVLSAGHASMLLYSLLHLTGYDLDLDQLKQFRQWDSRTPGHPERGHTAGVEVTTGPLGQGLSNAVGLAIAERMLAARFNRPDHAIVDHRTYAICSDGDLMEGIGHEAASLAGHQKLGKLICFYDDNKISIAGSTSLTFTEDVATTFGAAGWRTIRVADANDLDGLDQAIQLAKSESMRPTMILIRSHIGYGSPHRQDTKEAHGEPLGEEEVRLTKRAYGWPEDETFLVPAAVREHFRPLVEEGERRESDWRGRFLEYHRAHPAEAAEFERVIARRLPEGWEKACTEFHEPETAEATRSSSGSVIQRLAESVPELVGGSADLDPSTKTFIRSSKNHDAEHPGGRNLQFGVREHVMGGIVNGIAAHGGLRPFGATFFVFSDYMRPAIRIAALSRLPSIFVYTHDSIGLGEDGPTHQPIEHLASLRAMPNVRVIRPADARETAEAWQAALERIDGPTVLVLTRQKLPPMDRSRGGAGWHRGAGRGAYVLREVPDEEADLTLLATGSEVVVAMGAADLLGQEGIRVRVVSMPSWELFLEQGDLYRSEVFGEPDGLRLSVEAAASFGWDRWVNPRGSSVAIDRFGASAPGDTNMEKFGFTAAAVAERARTLIKSRRRTS
jgi:transketolase